MVAEDTIPTTDTPNPTNYDTATISSGGDDFGRRIALTAAAQILESVGYDSATVSALDALADVAVRFVRDLGRSASARAVLSGRSSSNELDFLSGLEDLGLVGPHRHHCLVGSPALAGISAFIRTTEEVPFAAPIPKFPVAKLAKKAPSFSQMGEEPTKNIPDWLPAFPDPHTYIFTPMWNERTSDPRMDKLEQARQRRKGEQSLLSLQKRIIQYGASRLVEDEKEVVVEEEAVKKLTAVSTFEPVLEAARNGGGFEEEGTELYKRNLGSWHFKFGVQNRSLVLPPSFGGRGDVTDSWLLRDDEKDDKKRRAELILKECMAKPHDLMQL